jgi:hypothetical protein
VTFEIEPVKFVQATPPFKQAEFAKLPTKIFDGYGFEGNPDVAPEVPVLGMVNGPVFVKVSVFPAPD